MFDNLREKTRKTADTPVDDIHVAGDPDHDDIWVTPRDTVKNAGVEARAASDNEKNGSPKIVSDPGITGQRTGTSLTKVEL